MNVDAFDGQAGAQGHRPWYVEKVGGGTRQKGPQALASAYRGVTHRFDQPGAGVGGKDQHPFEQSVDIRRNPRKRLIDPGPGRCEIDDAHAMAIRLNTVDSGSDGASSRLSR